MEADLEAVDTRQSFFSAMADLQTDFIDAVTDIQVRESALKAAIAQIRNLLQDGVGQTALPPSHPLARLMAEFNGELASIVRDWLDRVEQYDRNTEFRKGLTDSFVVFVLGKVKAGKSSLGNYIAYGCSNGAAERATGSRPHFFTAAMTQGADGEAEAASGPYGHFRVGVRETTKSIQGFRVPGLTWVDTPGLHSVTPENGALASDYADVADIIVYPMHSACAGRAGDISEIRGLLCTGKRFVIIITQCDRPVEDEAPDGSIVQEWFMKDETTRQGQIDYVRRAVAGGSEPTAFDILSLSVRHAETHDNDQQALEDSGMASFFRLLTDIARSEGVRHKRETPSRNLDNFVDLLGSGANVNTLSVAQVHSRLDDLEKRLTATAAEIDRMADRTKAAVLNRIAPAVSKQIGLHASDHNQEGFERGCTDALRRILTEETLAQVQSLLTATGRALVPVVYLNGISGFLKFEKLTVEVPKSNRGWVGAIGKAVGGAVGVWGGAEAGAIAGSIVPGPGTVVGGLLGAAIGAWLFGLAGNAAADKAFGSDWNETMHSGDNRARVAASAVRILQAAGQAAVQDFFGTVQGAAVASVRHRARRLVHGLEVFSHTLETKVRSNG